MVLQLHIWGPAFGLPSIDAECIAAVAYLFHALGRDQWALIPNYDTSIGPQNSFPLLIDDAHRISGFTSIVSYLERDTHPVHTPIDINNLTAYITFLSSTATPLIGLSLYVSSENYHTPTGTASAYTAILPWYLNYTIPPTRRDQARARTSHLGLSGLDQSLARDGEERAGPGSLGLSNDFEAAKNNAGIPKGESDGARGGVMSMGRGKGLKGVFSSPILAAKFRLDALTNELLEPLSDLLGDKDYLLGEHNGCITSLDYLAFGYLSLMLYPSVPQAWVREAIQTRFPRIERYIKRMRDEILGNEKTNAADVWSLRSINPDDAEAIASARTKMGLNLPWHPPPSRPFHSTFAKAGKEWAYNFPLLSKILPNDAIIYDSQLKVSRTIPSALPSPLLMNTLYTFTVALAAALAGMAVHHRKNPRDGDLIFWALRPTANGLGEAGDLLRAAMGQLPI